MLAVVAPLGDPLGDMLRCARRHHTSSSRHAGVWVSVDAPIVARNPGCRAPFIGLCPYFSQLLPPTRDTLSFTGEPAFFTEDGSITTRNVGVFQPGPFGVGLEFGTVIAGTGKYAQATGI